MRRLAMCLRPAMALMIILALQLGTATASPARQEKTEIKYFSAKVVVGPDKGVAVTGKMELLMEPSGAFTGSLVRSAGSALPVSGQVTGSSFSVTIQLGKGKAVFGAGNMLGSLKKDGVAAGTFAGPNDLDFGVWEVCIGVRTSSGTCYGIYIG